MRKISITDIRNRLRSRLEGEENLEYRDRYERLAERTIDSGYPSQLITVMEYGIIDNDRLSLNTMCELFDALYERDDSTPSQIIKYGKILLKEYVDRVRDAKETNTYLKRKLGRVKSKLTTRVQNNFDNIKDAFNSMLQGAKSNASSNIQSMKKAGSAMFPNNPLAKKKKQDAKKEAAYIEAYENMLAESTKLVSIDRILENYNRVSKRFNIDRIIQENTVINGVADTIIELCNLIDTYDMPVKARYNTCLETIWYGFHKNSFPFDESELVTTVTDYYMAHGKNGVACASILESSIVFDKDDYMGDIEVLTEEEPEEILGEDDNVIKQLAKEYEIKKCLDEIRPKAKEIFSKSKYAKRIKVITGYKGESNDNYVRWHICCFSDNWSPDQDPELIPMFDKVANAVRDYIGKNKSKFELYYINDDDDYIYIGIRVPVQSISEVNFVNSKGDKVPKVCPKCGSKIGVFFRGEPVFICSNKDCEEYFGTVPFHEVKLSAKDKAKLKDSDYGIPSKKKYPMPDESHVRSAIQMFNHVDKEDEAELAKNIKKKIKQYGMSVGVGKDNRFSKYYTPSNETATIQSQIREFATGNSGYIVIREGSVDFNKILSDFKASNEDHKETKLKALVSKLYSNDVDNVVEGTPNLLKYIRAVFVIGSFAIPVVGPIVGIVAFIADRFLALHMDRENTIKMRTAFQNEIRATDKKINSTKNNEEKKRLEEYKKALLDAYKKIDTYYEGLLNDEELDEKYDADDDSDIVGSGFDLGDDFKDDFGDGFFDMDDEDMGDLEGFGETAKAVILMNRLADNLEFTCPIKSFDQAKCHKMLITSPSLIKELGDIAIHFENLINPDDLRRAIDDVKSDAKIGNVRLNMVERYDLDNTYRDLKYAKGYTKTSDVFAEARELAIQIEIIRALNEVYSSCVFYSPITEASFSNTLKLASEKIKKGIQKMSDKDKEISNKIDVGLNNFKKSAERAVEADNREAVIKGSVLPSASKLIKLAIVNAGLGILIHPAVAVIGVLGYFAISKATKEKQRRAILDEIEIELKMCQKYIDLAESKNDLKALKKLYEIQRNLERQRAKIKFNLQIKGEKYKDPGDFDQHGVSE